MKAENLCRGLTQYQDLFEIENIDEFIYCIVYEFAVRDIKDKLIEMFKVFAIENDKVVLVEEEIQKQIFSKESDKELLEKAKKYTANGNYLDELYTYWILFIEDELYYQLGLPLASIYIDYHFFTDGFKEVFAKIINSQILYDENRIHNNCIKTLTYHHSEFSRVTKLFPKMKNDDFRIIETHYSIKYKRPTLFPGIMSNQKNADITINTDLPKEMILQQVSRLIDMMKTDNNNIISNEEMNTIADAEYYKITKEAYKNKQNFIDQLIINDFMELKTIEVQEENKERKRKKEEKISNIKKLASLTKVEKSEEIKKLNKSFKKITKADMRQSVAGILNLSISTIETYEKEYRKLLKNRNYLKLLHGKNKGGN